MNTLKKLKPYMGSRKILLPVSLVLSGLSGLMSLLPFVFVWFIVRSLLDTGGISAEMSVDTYAWWAVAMAVGTLLIYFTAVMLSHLAAFRVETNMRRMAMRKVLDMPLGVFSKETARRLIVTVTDKARGALKTLADQQGYKSFVIEDNVGGRFSVLSPVGLLPIAVAGFDIRLLMKGAKQMEQNTSLDVNFDQNIAMQYAAARNILYGRGKKVEVMANFNSKLHYIAEWWKQLYGESEGKEQKGIFPASVDFTTDLHSMGQYLQEGERFLFETVLSVGKPNNEKRIAASADNLDGLNFLSNQRIDYVNKMAELGTMLAHIDGGVPNIKITMPKIDEYWLGQLLYFFEKACGISGYMLGVNPFDQPGVEAYKKNMFALLQKPGYENQYEELKTRLKL